MFISELLLEILWLGEISLYIISILIIDSDYTIKNSYTYQYCSYAFFIIFMLW